MQIVDIVQYMWSIRDIPRELGWIILVFILKGNIYTQGIVLLDTLWKVLEVIIDTRLQASIQFHYILHRLHAVRDTSNATMELKISQELSIIDQGPIFLVFLDLRKDYSNVDRDRLIKTLEVYGAGPHMCKIQATLWVYQEVGTKKKVTTDQALRQPRGQYMVGSSH